MPQTVPVPVWLLLLALRVVPLPMGLVPGQSQDPVFEYRAVIDGQKQSVQASHG
jgi:hypothetical protein